MEPNSADGTLPVLTGGCLLPVNISEKAKLELDIAEGKVQCTYCSELATKLNESGQPECDIPGNH